MKIAIYGHFGSLNSGNESTLLSVVHRLRGVYPDCDLWCICSNPESLAAMDELRSVPITTRVARIWNRQLPLGGRLRTLPFGASEELRQYARALKTLKGSDMFVIPGTGLLSDAYGLSGWGPYNLLKWTLAAKLCGSRVIFLSVGAGPINGRLGRSLIKFALTLADYRSYRDEASKNYISGIGFGASRDRVYPDLVFGLPTIQRFQSQTQIQGKNAQGKRVVGLGLMMMEYARAYSDGGPEVVDYPAYLGSLAALVEWLLQQGYDIRLLLGDDDATVIEDFRSQLQSRVGRYDAARILYEPTATVSETLAQLALTDIVVATRFHNILLALLLDKPVIAVSFHHKCSSIMSQLGLSEYCYDIRRLSGEKLIEGFQRLEKNSKDVRKAVRVGVEESRNALDEQYDLVFKGHEARPSRFG
jgi:polysaccharide pyruvyl transferase WcaK-like protein